MIDWASMFSAMSDEQSREAAVNSSAAKDDADAVADDKQPLRITDEQDNDAEFWRLAGADDTSRPIIDFGLIGSGGGRLIGEPLDDSEVLLMELRERYGRRLDWVAVRSRGSKFDWRKSDVTAGQ